MTPTDTVKLDLEGIKARFHAAMGDGKPPFYIEMLCRDVAALLDALAQAEAALERSQAGREELFQKAARLSRDWQAAEARADAYREALDTIAQWGCDLAEDYDGTCGSKIVRFARAALAGSGSGKERDE